MLPPSSLPALLLATLAPLPTHAPHSHAFCSSRADCTGHGACSDDRASCHCDAEFHGARCDVWRAPVAADDLRLLRGVEWENCTHGRAAGGNGSAAVMKLCEMHNKTVCEAAGAPTVPPPDFNTSSCYGKPDAAPGSNNHNGGAGNASGFYNSGLCKDYRGVATVIHGLQGVFCARPCAQAGQLSCDACRPECKITNASTGECAYCSGERGFGNQYAGRVTGPQSLCALMSESVRGHSAPAPFLALALWGSRGSPVR